MLLWSVLLASPAGAVEYVRDEIRINMRAGPGLQFKIRKLLTSGEAVTRLEETSDWVRIRTGEGEEGWVPSGYLATDQPASVALPQVRAKLTQAEGRLEQLEARLSAQTEALADLDSLRDQNQKLTAENQQLSFSSGWRWMITGAGILMVGALLGLIVPRGAVAQRNRLRL